MVAKFHDIKLKDMSNEDIRKWAKVLPNDNIATSVVPPPISTTIDPDASVTGKLAPIAAAIGSSIK